MKSPLLFVSGGVFGCILGITLAYLCGTVYVQSSTALLQFNPADHGPIPTSVKLMGRFVVADPIRRTIVADFASPYASSEYFRAQVYYSEDTQVYNEAAELRNLNDADIATFTEGDGFYFILDRKAGNLQASRIMKSTYLP